MKSRSMNVGVLSRLSIRIKLTALLLAAAIIPLTFATVAFVNQWMASERESVRQHVNSTALVLADNVAAALTFTDYDAASDVLAALKRDTMIDAVAVYDSNDSVVAKYRRTGAPAVAFPNRIGHGWCLTHRGYVELFVPVLDMDECVGAVFVRANTRRYTADVRRFTRIIMVTLGGALLASLLFAAVVYLMVSRPIISLARMLKGVSDTQDYSSRVPPRGMDEIGVLFDSFNELLAATEVAQCERQRANEMLEQRVIERTEELSQTNNQMREEIATRVQAEEELRAAERELVDTARKAGMAEVATGVLHNIGNVLNSVNVSLGLALERVRRSPAANAQKAAQLLRDHEHELDRFLTSDERGSHFLDFFDKLASQLSSDRSQMLEELSTMERNIEHIKNIVATQQDFARATKVREPQDLVELLENAVAMVERNLTKAGVDIVRNFDRLPEVKTDRSRVLQILVNLVTNAYQAMRDHESSSHQLLLTVAREDDQQAAISVADTGGGISSDNLQRIFQHGFTTKKDGHGFGLHSSALAARELGGTLSVDSPGVGQGAVFTLRLPMECGADCHSDVNSNSAELCPSSA